MEIGWTSSVKNNLPKWESSGIDDVVVSAGSMLAQGKLLNQILIAARVDFEAHTGGSEAEFGKAIMAAFNLGTNLNLTDWRHLSPNLNSVATNTVGFDAYQTVANPLIDFLQKFPTGFSPLLRSLYILAQSTDPAIAQKAQAVLTALRALGIDPSIIANDTSDKLTAFFVDGTYNFTYILFPTAVLQNGAAGSGTCVISSNYDVNTQLLDKKSLINSFLDPQPQTILQSFDINSNSIVMDTYGSSLSGKFGFKEDGSALNTVETGYDATYGTFTTFYRFYIKTQIGFLISNYNKDTDELHSVWFYSIVPKATDVVPTIRP